MDVVGLILAAGQGSRLGRPKALMEIMGLTALERAILVLERFPIQKVVVLGAQAEVVVRCHHLEGVNIVFNPEWQSGDMLSSLQSGLRFIGDARHVLVHLVDHPAIQWQTVARLLDCALHSDSPLVRPSTSARFGHPVVFGGALLNDLKNLPRGRSPREALSPYFPVQEIVEVDDPGILCDVDTPEELAMAYDLLLKKEKNI